MAVLGLIFRSYEFLNPARGWTDLHFAVYYNNLSRIDQHIENGADINVRNGDGETPLHIACLGDSECIKAILKYNPSMNVAEKRKHLTPLILFVTYFSHRTSTLRMMLKMGADPNLSQIEGDTPLHIIADADDSEKGKALKYAVELIKFKANVNAQNNFGDTPLHIAMKTGFTEIIRILLKNGADVTIENCLGQNPIHYAIFTRRKFDGSFIEIGQYIIKQTSIGKIIVDQDVLDEFFELNNLKYFKEKCDEELSELKSNVTDRTSVTYYDFLVLPLDVVGKYLRNEDILESAMALDETKYIFGKQFSKIFRDALLRNVAIDIGCKFFRKFSPVILPDLCMDLICKHLTNNDLWNLMNFTC
ncbi:hypothetical protein WA026_023500 [Henosepilachna vigintioctopunctata]|uniref:PRANC domain-containing protein n=1 Tax=Henosepilachna vigintioctopunctata TaxID=420089 RepID=A0AAW1UDK3_9CUCU